MKIFLGTIGALLLLVGLAWFVVTKPDRTIDRNPIMKSIKTVSNSWDIRVNLKNNVLNNYKTKEQIQTYLDGLGFELNEDFRFFFTEDIVKDNETVWSKTQNSIVCEIEWSVIAAVDENDLVISADGVQSARACL